MVVERMREAWGALFNTPAAEMAGGTGVAIVRILASSERLLCLKQHN